MNTRKIFVIRLSSLMFLALLLFGCSSGNASNTITIDAPNDISALLTKGAGDKYSYYAIMEFAPADWDDVSKGTLWICNDDDHISRPPLIPETIVRMLNGGGFPSGTLLELSWTDQEGAPDSSELSLNKIYTTIGITYEGCIENAIKKITEGRLPSLLLTDTDGKFDGKDRLVIVEFN